MDALPSELRRRIGLAWRDAATAEHASSVALRRFVMELLALGAPLELVGAAHHAIADETMHAWLAFALASAYLGEPVGPDAAASQHAARNVAAIVHEAIVDGCIGKTIAVARAEHALALVEDPAVRRVLAVIARDEARHAALAWRFVAWALHEHPELRQLAVATFDRAPTLAAAAGDPDAASLRAHGIVPTDDARTLVEIAFTELVRPCADALLDEVPTSAAA
ncbi:MAG TPA: hypothetical protein VG755_23490 [Nannocystaceae bacterium]|nr:hypothetical protein [Nannocystaceae bacterium]